MTEPETARHSGLEKVIQFSIFIENRVGALLDLVNYLHAEGVTILASSIIDTADCAIDRFVVDDPDRARLCLHEQGFLFSERAVVAVELRNGAAQLRELLQALYEGECNIHSIYSFMIQPRGYPCVALHVDDDDVATSVLQSNGFEVLKQSELAR